MRRLYSGVLGIGVLISCLFGTAFAETSSDTTSLSRIKKSAVVSESEGNTKVSGDLSHRFWVKTDSENSKGVHAVKRVFAERLRLQLENTQGNWNWKLGVSTISSSNLTASLVELGRETDHILSYKDFLPVNAYVEYKEKSDWSVRLGRTQNPFNRLKSEMLWDNDDYWDGMYVEKSLPGLGNKTRFHGGAFEIHRDLAWRGDHMYLIGLFGTPKCGNIQYEWRLDRFQYGISNLKDNPLSSWQQQTKVNVAAYAPGYRTTNVYGAVEWPQQIRLTVDASRNFAANSPVASNKGGDAINATMVLGKLKQNGNFQSILQYLKVGAQAVPPNFVSYFKRMNMQGFQWDVKMRITKKTEIQVMYLDWKRLEGAIATDKRYRRWETSLNHNF
ncbi:MAG: hypothetical protein HQM09_05700 [Candidatus Riflebacteria bacterium]|nr:hypothetical protein [Candidatus Riflebacteria bacterium]